MNTIAIEPELYQRVAEVATENQTTADEILAEAVRHYLWEMNNRKISEESKLYRQRHAEIKQQYLGQWIAMRNGAVVDHDADFDTLRQRVHARFRHAPVMMTLVEEEPERVLWRRGFVMEKPLP